MKTIIWVDLETTGLDPQADSILEVYMASAPFLDPFNATPLYHAVLKYDPIPSVLDTHHPTVREMHTKNGLWEECRGPNAKSFEEVREDLYRLVPIEAEKDDMPIWGGSTVSFDRDFIREHFPYVAKRFSHRLYDITALKLFCASMGMPKIPKGEAHRAEADIAESIHHGKLCKAWLLFQAGREPFNPGGLIV